MSSFFVIYYLNIDDKQGTWPVSKPDNGDTQKSTDDNASKRKNRLRKVPSRVQFFIESNLSEQMNRTVNRQHLEDSPTESFVSEYSGSDLRMHR